MSRLVQGSSVSTSFRMTSLRASPGVRSPVSLSSIGAERPLDTLGADLKCVDERLPPLSPLRGDRPAMISIGAKAGRRPRALCRVPGGRGHENSARLSIGDLKSVPPSRPSVGKTFRMRSLIHNRFLALHAAIREVGKRINWARRPAPPRCFGKSRRRHPSRAAGTGATASLQSTGTQ